MNYYAITLIIAICLLSPGCSRSPDLYAQYQLVPTVLHIEIARQAIKNINILLHAEGLPEYYLYDEEHNREGIALLWVGDKTISQTVADMMFVPRGCQCVIVQPRVLYSWVENYSTVGETNYADMDNLPHTLGYFLLHEYGHIHSGHPGRAISTLGDNTNRDETESKRLEQTADDFASNLVAKYQSKTGAFKTWMSAANIGLNISSLAFTLQGKRIIDNFGCSVLDAPCAFHDMGDTHYNLEYRILKAQCLISGGEACGMLSSYEQRRNSGGVFQKGALYRAE
ncbi:MAG: hypothetical protein CME59_16355 [Halioglobus sp.]|nr:hypothetical protein [Halioglobus sp.]